MESSGFKPRAGRRCPACHRARCRAKSKGELVGPVGELYQVDSFVEGFEQVTIFGCDVCESGWTVRKNRGLVEILLDGGTSIVDVQQRRPYTFVDVSVSWDGKRWDGIGFSKVCVPDEWVPEKGIEVATRHAVEHIVQDNHLRLPVRPKREVIEEMAPVAMAM